MKGRLQGIIHLSILIPSLIACFTAVMWKLPLLESHRSWLFGRSNEDFECSVTSRLNDDPVSTNYHQQKSPLVNEEDMENFKRDGVILLRNVISEDWLQAYRKLLTHVYHNPNTWDILYSRLVGNFYGAQKSIFLHQSSVCGRYIGSNSPVTKIAADLFSYQHQEKSSKQPHPAAQLRVMEPNLALMNYGNGEGHTSWHTDDPYMSYKTHGENHDVIRIWIPLMDMLPSQMKMMALNNSKTSKIQREKNGLGVITGTNFSIFEELDSSHVINEQIIGPGEEGYRAGDVLFFAGDTPHFAQGLNCSSTGCARLILSYALDGKAIYESGKITSLLPLQSGQENGRPLFGKQFPLIYPSSKVNQEDWNSPFDFLTYGDILRSLWHAAYAGLYSFRGFEVRKALPYFYRVYKAIEQNIWVKPILDLDSGIRKG